MFGVEYLPQYAQCWECCSEIEPFLSCNCVLDECVLFLYFRYKIILVGWLVSFPGRLVQRISHKWYLTSKRSTERGFCSVLLHWIWNRAANRRNYYATQTPVFTWCTAAHRSRKTKDSRRGRSIQVNRLYTYVLNKSFVLQITWLALTQEV